MRFISPFLVNGTIQLLGYENQMKETWYVEADCNEVNIQSEMFQTEQGWDFLTISDQENSQGYSGDQLVNQNASSIFSIEFESDGAFTMNGFVLKWTCIKPTQT